MTEFLGRLITTSLGYKAGLGTLYTLWRLRHGNGWCLEVICYLPRIEMKARENEGLPVTSLQSLSSGHFHLSISYMLNLVLSRLNSVSLPFLPNRILHLYFPTRIMISSFYHVLKIIILKLIFKLLSLPHTFHYHYSNFYQDVLSLITTICQIGTVCTLSPVPSAVL